MSPSLEIEVVHIRNYGKKSKMVDPTTAYLYCGRGSIWGNRHRMTKEEDRAKVIEDHSNDPVARANTFKISRWCLLHPEVNKLLLGCYCHPKDCHCDTMRGWILEDLKK